MKSLTELHRELCRLRDGQTDHSADLSNIAKAYYRGLSAANQHAAELVAELKATVEDARDMVLPITDETRAREQAYNRILGQDEPADPTSPHKRVCDLTPTESKARAVKYDQDMKDCKASVRRNKASRKAITEYHNSKPN
jgi:hypothetical protein